MKNTITTREAAELLHVSQGRVRQLVTAEHLTATGYHGRALVLNLAAEPGETGGFSAERHLHVLNQHAPEFTVHEIIVDAQRVPGDRERDQLRRTAMLLDAQVEFADPQAPIVANVTAEPIATGAEDEERISPRPLLTTALTLVVPRSRPRNMRHTST